MGIIDYLESAGVQVKYARGGWQPCKCPYHQDRTASASVNTTKDRFHCFVCDINEDVVGLIRKDTGVSYVEAKQEAEEKYGTGPVRVAGEPTCGGLLPDLAGNHSGNSGSVSSWRSQFS